MSPLSDPFVSNTFVPPTAVNILTASEPFLSLDYKLMDHSHTNTEALSNNSTTCNGCTNMSKLASETVLPNKTNKGSWTELEVKQDIYAMASELAMMTTATSSIRPNATEFYEIEEISQEESDVIHPSETLYLSITREEPVTASLDDQIDIEKLKSMDQDKSISGRNGDKLQIQNKTGGKSNLNYLDIVHVPTLKYSTTPSNSYDYINTTASNDINPTVETYAGWTQNHIRDTSFLNSKISALKTTTESISVLGITSHFEGSSIVHSETPSSEIPSCQNNVFSETSLTRATTYKSGMENRFPVVYLEVVSDHICTTRKISKWVVKITVSDNKACFSGIIMAPVYSN